LEKHVLSVASILHGEWLNAETDAISQIIIAEASRIGAELYSNIELEMYYAKRIEQRWQENGLEHLGLAIVKNGVDVNVVPRIHFAPSSQASTAELATHVASCELMAAVRC
jgi:hypothetical protein